ncbi:uncharacterized protein LOC113232116, partial [Hyposmocoma kahamanoa]|uniref:uncharacterized protein LOC113232116 n=1 Tax=Hyposmocoma kahamanoa TaxID=1477025 RepID=UPI000E6D9E57
MTTIFHFVILLILCSLFYVIGAYNRPHLSNAILYEIKSNDNGDFCETNTTVTVDSGKIMVKIYGNYDKLDHVWCQNLLHEEGEKPESFLIKSAFREYENPKEAIATI